MIGDEVGGGCWFIAIGMKFPGRRWNSFIGNEANNEAGVGNF